MASCVKSTRHSSYFTEPATDKIRDLRNQHRAQFDLQTCPPSHWDSFCFQKDSCGTCELNGAISCAVYTSTRKTRGNLSRYWANESTIVRRTRLHKRITGFWLAPTPFFSLVFFSSMDNVDASGKRKLEETDLQENAKKLKEGGYAGRCVRGCDKELKAFQTRRWVLPRNPSTHSLRAVQAIGTWSGWTVSRLYL